jgi:hypothetical protein
MLATQIRTAAHTLDLCLPLGDGQKPESAKFVHECEHEMSATGQILGDHQRATPAVTS